MYVRKNERCHDHCKDQTTHSTCFLAQPLRRPILDQMIHKIETLPNSKQNLKRFGQYARVEQIFKSKAN